MEESTKMHTVVHPKYANRKIAYVWKDNLLRKIFLDILGNSQFRLCKHLKKDFCKKLSILVNKRKLSDNRIYTEMHKWTHIQLKGDSKELLLKDNNEYRGTNRAEKIQELTNKYLNTVPNSKDTSGINVLDIGCAEGAITVMVGKYMKINADNMHGCDIEQLTADNPYNSDFTFTHLTEETNYNLPYLPNSHDVVLALMSLHHIPNKQMMLDEIYRILKPGGLLIIREHDCVNNGFSAVLDIVHGFYSMVWANPQEMNNFDSYYAKYSSAYILTKDMKTHGFKEKYNNRLTDFPRFYKGKIINPLNYYYGVYEKKDECDIKKTNDINK